MQGTKKGGEVDQKGENQLATGKKEGRKMCRGGKI